MSVYLDRSPYYLSRKRVGSVRRARRVGRSGKKLWSFGFGNQKRQVRGAVVQNYHNTGRAVKNGAQFFGQMVDAVKNVKGRKEHFEIGSTAVMAGLGVVCVLLSFAYLAHFAQVSTKGYELKRLQADRHQLLSQHEIKTMRLAEVKSLITITSSERIEGMRRPRSVDYVQGNTVLASR